MSRYTFISTPDGLYAVWDQTTDTPARLDGKELIRLTLDRATVARNILQRIEDAGMSARPPNQSG